MSRVGDMLFGDDSDVRWHHVQRALEAERRKQEETADHEEERELAADLDDTAEPPATRSTPPRNPWRISPPGDTKPGAGNVENSAPLASINPPGDPADGAS